MNNKNIIIVSIIAVILVGSGSFYGGMQYQESQASVSQWQGKMQNGGGQLGNRTGDGKQGGQSGQANQIRNVNRGNMVAGEIISKDDKSITVKTAEGGSKIVYFSDGTKVGKSTEGLASDLEQGKQVMVNGTANSDGSLAADNIQIRPDVPVGQQ